MSSPSVAEYTTGYLEGYIKDNWADSKNGFKRHILARAGNALLAPISPIPHLVDAILGVAEGVSAIATGGMCKSINKVTKVHLETSTNLIIAQPYALCLRTLNPKAEFYYEEPGFKLDHRAGGIITFSISTNGKRKADKYVRSKNFWKRHIVSRLTYAGLALACVITRIVDSIIGLIATPLSLVTFGKFKTFNFLAYQGLQPLGIVYDIFKYTIMMINPQAKEMENGREDILVKK